MDNRHRELMLSALITNKRAQDATGIRLGCHITDMHNLANEYFAFLTVILGKQGLIPVSYTHLDVYKRQRINLSYPL